MSCVYVLSSSSLAVLEFEFRATSPLGSLFSAIYIHIIGKLQALLLFDCQKKE